MEASDFAQEAQRHATELAHAAQRTIPIKVGVAAEKFVKENFRQSGFQGENFAPWKPSKRIGRAKGAAGQHKALLSARNHLYSSTHHRVEPGQAVVYNDCEYAAVHNEGLHAGRGAGFEMPKRQFIGASPALDSIVEGIIDKEISKIINI